MGYPPYGESPIRCGKKGCPWRGYETSLRAVRAPEDPDRLDHVCPVCGEIGYFFMTKKEIAAWQLKKTKENIMEKIDRKFQLLAVNPVNGKIYTEEDAMVFCAKDAALPAALKAYGDECQRIGANPEHLESVALLIARVEQYQQRIESRVPDTVGDEIQRCIHGIDF